MKTFKVILVLVLGLSILMSFGCRQPEYIDEVIAKWGPPARVEKRGNYKMTECEVYFWYFQKSQVRGYNDRFFHGESTTGWVCVEIKTVFPGKIINIKKYWAQPNI